MITYKGFNVDFTCRDFQYEFGKEYEIYEKIKVCEKGFHACENPLDVLYYYDMLKSRFAEVEQSGEIDKSEDSTKVCSSKIKIKNELPLVNIAKLGIDWLIKQGPLVYNDNGYEYKQIGSKSPCDQIGSSGDQVIIASIGDLAQISSSGDYAKILSIGKDAMIGSSGFHAKIYSRGARAVINSSGDMAKVESIGDDSTICCTGRGSMISAKKDSWITLASWQRKGDTSIWIPKYVKTARVDGKCIKENTWYKLVDGEFVETCL
jgi:hypothetical protein